MTNGTTPRVLGPREAADEIREAFLKDRSSRLDPESIHALGFLKDVCANLGIESSPENVTHVQVLLREHDVILPFGAEYPKWVKGQLVKNADEEAKLHEPELLSQDDGPVGGSNADPAPSDPAPSDPAPQQEAPKTEDKPAPPQRPE